MQTTSRHSWKDSPLSRLIPAWAGFSKLRGAMWGNPSDVGGATRDCETDQMIVLYMSLTGRSMEEES